MPTVHFASTSPRRADLLNQIGISFQLRSVPVDETPWPHEAAEDYVTRLAQAKAHAGLQGLNDPWGCVLGADTAVVLDAAILGKPRHREEGLAMLQGLSGRTHQVMTAVALATVEQSVVTCVTTDVTFRALTQAEILAYWDTGEPYDKAGAYGIQGLAAVFVQRIQGSYSAVVGLPLCETAQLLASFGIFSRLGGD